MPTPKDNILDTPVLQLSANDVLDLRACMSGICITGSAGSGKSTCSGRQLSEGLLRVPQMGAVILAAKGEETTTWIERIRSCGREKDLVLFNLQSGHRYDPLHYERSRKGRGSDDPENLIEIFGALSSNGRKEQSQGDNLFFERATDELMRNAIVLLDLANEPISISSIDRVVGSLPTFPEEHEQESWQRESYCAQLVNQVRVRQDSLTVEQWSNLEVIADYLFRRWPALDERPRSSIRATWSGTASRFLLHPYRGLCSSGQCTISPRMTTHESKLILCDFPMLEVGFAMGRTLNTLLKVCFQRNWLRRDLSDSPNPVFLWADEAQYFLTKQDNFFQQTCRGSRVATVILTQNVTNISEEFGESQLGSKTKSYLGNIANHIFHQQNDVETANWASALIGSSYRPVGNYSAGGGQSHSIGGSFQLVPAVMPAVFSALQKPDGLNPLASAICYCGGATFNASKTERNPEGTNYLKVFFSRD